MTLVTESPSSRSATDGVPSLVRRSASWAWRLLAIGAAVVAVVYLLVFFAQVTVPFALAVLGAAMLSPVVAALTRRGVPRAVAVLGTLLVAGTVVTAFVASVARQITRGLPELVDDAVNSVERLRNWLVTGPIGLDPRQVERLGDDAVAAIQHNEGLITHGALLTVASLGEVVAGIAMALFVLIFLLYDGRSVWRFVTAVVPGGNRERVREAGEAGFTTLTSYVRTTVIVAFVDAVGIGIGLVVLQVPLAIPLAALVFCGAFIPIVGAFVAGTVAVLVALISHGWAVALITLLIVVAIMQIESHVLHPFLMGRSVRLHPLAVVLGIAVGGIAAGVIGALLAVPAIAFANSVVRYLLATRAQRDAAVAQPESTIIGTQIQPEES